MATPEFWSSEISLFTPLAADDGDYRWVLRGHEWVPAKTSPGKLSGCFIATAVDGTKFDCQSQHLAENIPSVAELKRLPDDLIHLDDMSEKSVVFALTQVRNLLPSFIPLLSLSHLCNQTNFFFFDRDLQQTKSIPLSVTF
jgi:hypothetical protein